MAPAPERERGLSPCRCPLIGVHFVEKHEERFLRLGRPHAEQPAHPMVREALVQDFSGREQDIGWLVLQAASSEDDQILAHNGPVQLVAGAGELFSPEPQARNAARSAGHRMSDSASRDR